MYKGNMYEAVERLSAYTQGEYGFSAQLKYNDIVFFGNMRGGEWRWNFPVTDSEDFERDIKANMRHVVASLNTDNVPSFIADIKIVRDV